MTYARRSTCTPEPALPVAEDEPDEPIPASRRNTANSVRKLLVSSRIASADAPPTTHGSSEHKAFNPHPRPPSEGYPSPQRNPATGDHIDLGHPLRNGRTKFLHWVQGPPISQNGKQILARDQRAHRSQETPGHERRTRSGNHSQPQVGHGSSWDRRTSSPHPKTQTKMNTKVYLSTREKTTRRLSTTSKRHNCRGKTLKH
eukprot:SAG31_NODE_6066_length_2185_cov_2.341802_1_plen_201_part_00